jgi:tetratricopeptide (TPR) repeat protein
VLGLRLVTALRYFWYMRGHLNEGRDRLKAGLAACGSLVDLATRCRALNALGFLHAIQGQYVEGRERLEEALRISRELKDDAGAAFALRYLGLIASGEGNYVLATAQLQESLRMFRELAAPGDIGLALMYLGDVALCEDDLERARRCFDESSAMLARAQNRTVLPYPLRRLGQLAYMRGDLRLAFQLCTESLTYNRAVGDRRGVAASLVGLALVASTQQPVIAAQLLSKADAVLGTIQSLLLSFDQQQFQLGCSRIRAQLEPLVWTAAWENGRRLTMDEAVRIVEELYADVER